MNRAIRTDLAIELREDIKDRGKIDGIEIETRISQEKIKTTIIFPSLSDTLNAIPV